MTAHRYWKLKVDKTGDASPVFVSVGSFELREAIRGQSILFNSSDAYLAVPNTSSLDFGTGDFTIEWWEFPKSSADKGRFHLYSAVLTSSTPASAAGLAVAYSAGSWVIYHDGSTTFRTASITLDAWHHIALIRVSGVIRLFVDGVQAGADIAHAGTLPNTATKVLTIGTYHTTNYLFNGHLADFRVTKGYARYTSGFTPTTSTFADDGTGDANYGQVSLLIHGTGVSGANTFPDTSPVVNPVTVYGGTIISDVQYKFGGANLSVTGSGTATASSDAGGALVPSKAFDSDIATVWNSLNSYPEELYWDFGVANEKDIVQATLVNGSAASINNSVQEGSIWYSDDAVTYEWWSPIVARTTTASYQNNYEYVAPGVATAAIVCPTLTLLGYGAMNGAVTMPVSFSAYGGANGAITMPMPLFAGHFGAIGAITLTGLSAYGTGHDSTGERELVAVMPMPTVLAYGGANGGVTMPMLTMVGAGTGTIIGHGALTMPMPTVTGTGVGGAVGSGEWTMSDSFSMIGYSGAVCSVTMGEFTFAATGTSGCVGRGAVTLPMFELVGSGTRENSGSGEWTMPMLVASTTGRAWLTMPMPIFVAIGTATVTATYEAYAINLKHTSDKAPDEVTRYTNFPFTHIVRYQNSYFGANENGLFLLEGTTDYAATPTAIPWSFKTAVSDFGYPEFKTIESAYIGGRLGPSETLTLHAGEGAQTQAYSYTTPRGELAQNYRQKFGKGIKNHRYYALGANGSGELVIDSIDFNVAKLSRRI